MHDLKYDLDSMKLAIAPGPMPIDSAFLEDAVSAFSANLERIAVIVTMPVALVGLGMIDHMRFPPWQAGSEERADVLDDDDVIESLYEFAREIVEASGDGTQPDPSRLVWAGLDAALSASIIGLWTAFESLASDLWESSINARPHLLTMKRKGQKTNTDADSKMLPILTIQKHGYDLRGKMGSIMKDRGIKFSTLDGINGAYRLAFREDRERIDKALHDPAVKALNAVRNLLVHRAGVVDRTFVDQVGSTASLSVFKIGESLRLDGDLWYSLVHQVVARSVDLIRAVDEWLVSN